MPVISVGTQQNPGTLDNFPEIRTNTQAQMTQSAQNACGAYAMVAAVGAFGLFKFNEQIAQNLNQFALIFGLIARNYRFPALAAAVYELSGILNPNRPQGNEIINPHLPNNIYPTGGYNSPAVLAAAARSLGRNVSINATQDGFRNLAALYPGESDRCIAVVGQQNVHIGTQQNPVNYKEPSRDETQVIVVIANARQQNQTLHMVARGSNNSNNNNNSNYYDPGTGRLQLNWGDPTNSQFPKKTAKDGTEYTFGGVWMTIS